MYIVLHIKISSICLCAVFAGMGNILDTNPEFLGRVLDVSPLIVRETMPGQVVD